MWFRPLPRKILSSFECLSPTLEDVQHGDVLTSNCWLLELEKFIADKSNNKTWFSNSSVSEKNEFEMVHPAWWHISWCILNYLRWEVFRLYTKKVFNCCQLSVICVKRTDSRIINRGKRRKKFWNVVFLQASIRINRSSIDQRKWGILIFCNFLIASKKFFTIHHHGTETEPKP